MANTLTADDILPMVAALSPPELIRLLRLIAVHRGGDRSAYEALPLGAEEFSSDEDPLGWDAEGWEKVERGDRGSGYAYCSRFEDQGHLDF